MLSCPHFAPSNSIKLEYTKINIVDVFVIHTFYLLAIHEARPHKGQLKVAERLRSVLHSEVHPSEIAGQLQNWILIKYRSWICVTLYPWLIQSYQLTPTYIVQFFKIEDGFQCSYKLQKVWSTKKKRNNEVKKLRILFHRHSFSLINVGRCVWQLNFNQFKPANMDGSQLRRSPTLSNSNC